jgi:hypothetical protein
MALGVTVHNYLVLVLMFSLPMDWLYAFPAWANDHGLQSVAVPLGMSLGTAYNYLPEWAMCLLAGILAGLFPRRLGPIVALGFAGGMLLAAQLINWSCLIVQNASRWHIVDFALWESIAFPVSFFGLGVATILRRSQGHRLARLKGQFSLRAILMTTAAVAVIAVFVQRNPFNAVPIALFSLGGLPAWILLRDPDAKDFATASASEVR